jgi:hypothetical protein
VWTSRNRRTLPPNRCPSGVLNDADLADLADLAGRAVPNADGVAGAWVRLPRAAAGASTTTSRGGGYARRDNTGTVGARASLGRAVEPGDVGVLGQSSAAPQRIGGDLAKSADGAALGRGHGRPGGR